MDRVQGIEVVEQFTPAELRHYVAEGHRLRAEAIAGAFRTAVRALIRVLRPPAAVVHERRERAQRARRVRMGLGALPGGVR